MGPYDRCGSLFVQHAIQYNSYYTSYSVLNCFVGRLGFRSMS